MADADEDTLLTGPARSSSAADDEDADDLDDTTADYRFLSKSHALPKRGTKDFEPLPTNSQASTLAASRQAMHDALAPERFHMPKNHVVGVYDPASGLTLVKRAKGTGLFLTTGRGTPAGIELLPEEALWMLERGTLDVRWPASWGGESGVGAGSRGAADKTSALNGALDGEEEDEDGSGIPMSLQGAYAAFIGLEAERGSALTLERYQVYAHLRRSGFVVLRAEGFDGALPPSPPQRNSGKTPSYMIHKNGLFGWLQEKIFQSAEERLQARQRQGPLVQPGLYRSYNEIYRALNLIPTRLTTKPSPNVEPAPNLEPGPDVAPLASTSALPALTATYKLYSPTNLDGTAFRKSAPGPPDFHICVLSAADCAVPTLGQLTSLLASCSTSSPATSSSPPTPNHSLPKPSPATAIALPAALSPSTYPFLSLGHHAAPKPHASPPSLPNSGTIGHAYGRLKNGVPSAVLAVVDCGVIGYMRVGEAAFAEEEVFRRFEAFGDGRGRGRGGKRRGGGFGGGAGGRGRGAGGARGRGRGV